MPHDTTDPMTPLRHGRHSARITAHGAPLVGVDLDLNHIPDAAMTIATAALFAKGPTDSVSVTRARAHTRAHAPLSGPRQRAERFWRV
jgi:5-enolpyruvylshikimate-3-phosphate synthase